MVDVRVKPCPFCGTHPDDADHPSVSVETFDAHQTECGKCGACWPKLKRSDLSDDMTDDDLIAFFNRRSTLSDAVAEREAEPVARARVYMWKDRRQFSVNELGTKTAGELPVGVYDLYTSPPTSELEALRKRVAELEMALDPFVKYTPDKCFKGSKRYKLVETAEAGGGWFGAEDFRTARRVREGGKVE